MRLSQKILATLFLAAVLAAIAFTNTVAAEPAVEAREFQNETGDALLYRIQKPPGYIPEIKYPLVLCLHGAGGRGDDNKSRGTEAFTVLSSPEMQKAYPSFLLTPQCPKDGRWANRARDENTYSISSAPMTTEMGLVLEILDSLQNEFSIDPARLYVTGQSMGGFGTWDILQRNPGLFAAAVPVCGGGDVSQVKRVAHVPIWVFHGGKDTVVPTKYSRDIVAALKKEGSKVKYTEYPDVGHGSWTPAWQEKELISWLFKQKLPANTAANSIWWNELSTEDQKFLDTVQRKAFNYFWDGFDPVTGLIADKAKGRRTSIAHSGFGLSAFCIGVDRGWVARQEAYDRVLLTLNSYYDDPDDANDLCVEGKYGLFYHFINVDTGKRTGRTEVSTIDSALLMAGILHAMTYFEGTEVEELATKIYGNAQWNKFTNRRGAITGGYKPSEENWENPEYKGYNEYSLVYLIGMGSPTNPLPESSWDAYSSGNGYEWLKPYRDIGPFMTPKGVFQAQAYLYQFPACWYDFRNKEDNYVNHWEVAVNALKANRRYTQNWGSMVGYSEELWGWTACAGPRGYVGFSKPYNGTLAPSAVIASLPFLPEESLRSAKYMFKTYGDKIWGEFGFVDAFNPNQDWYHDGYIGIDKGNEVLMLENFRSEGVWRTFMQNSFVQKGLEKAKFRFVD